MKRTMQAAVSIFAAVVLAGMLTALAFRADAKEQRYIKIQPQLQLTAQEAEQYTQTGSLDEKAESSEAEIPLSDDLILILENACRRNAVNKAFAIGVMETESGFDAAAVNNDCFGLMQLDLRYENYFIDGTGLQNVTEPANNMIAGVWYLGQLTRQYSSPELVLMVYNLGPERAEKLWKQGVKSTEYTEKVLAAAQRWEKRGV